MRATSPDDFDGSVGDLFRAHRKRQLEKRRSNAEATMHDLRTSGVPFTVHNDGEHIIVGGNWDLYPKSGRFGKPKREGRGIFALLDIIKGDSNEQRV